MAESPPTATLSPVSPLIPNLTSVLVGMSQRQIDAMSMPGALHL